MDKKLLIIMANLDTKNPEAAAAPLFQATVAAAMGVDVEVVFTGLAGSLAAVGNAEKLEVKHQDHRSMLDIIKAAHKAGAILKVSAPTLELWGENMIDEIDEVIGTAYLIKEAMDDNTVTFTY